MKPILLLHGALGDKIQLSDLEEKLSPPLECYRFNFYGHGQDAKNDRAYSIQEFAKQLRIYIIQEKMQGVSIFGYSMGGYIALYLARFYPELVGPIITYGTKFDWNPETAQREANFLNPDLLRSKAPMYVKLLESRHGENWKGVLKKTADFLLKLGDNPILQEGDLQYVQHPVLILHGSKDFTADAETSQMVSQLLLDGEYQELEDFPHAIEKADKEVLTHEILQFIR